MKKVIFVLLALVAAGALGWYFGQRGHSDHTGAANGSKIAFYQSAMHPWIRSDKPGNCTICGMKLTPVYEGEKGFDIDGNVVTLSSNAINVLHVQTEPAELHPIERRLTVAGKIEAPESSHKQLAAYVDGRIEKLFVNFVGAEVRQGEPLAILYSPALLTAEREYLTALAQTNLASSPRLAPEHERLVAGARMRLKRLGLNDEQISEIRTGGATNLTTQVVAPIGGTVVTRAVVEGQYVKEGDKLFEIADLSHMWFRFDVYEQDLPSIHFGQIVHVTSPALGDKALDGPITFIDPNINEASRSARVRVELENPVVAENGRQRRPLYNGLYANGSITLRISEPVLSVSRGAVIDPGDQPRVYVDKGGGAYEHRPVVLGERGERFVEIRQGLSPGERVVTAGNLLLDSQAQINQTGSAPQPVHPTETEGTSSLSDEQNKAAADLFALVSKIAEALAADNPEGFNQQLGGIPEQATKLETGFATIPQLTELAAAVANTANLKPAQNLESARTQFLPFSMAVAEFTRALRKNGGNVAVKVYKCPMYPEAGKTAYWIQAQGPLRNPFFGSEMLDCGQEVK
jgi:membrane fusion protein, copper/silver efflux system